MIPIALSKKLKVGFKLKPLPKPEVKRARVQRYYKLINTIEFGLVVNQVSFSQLADIDKVLLPLNFKKRTMSSMVLSRVVEFNVATGPMIFYWISNKEIAQNKDHFYDQLSTLSAFVHTFAIVILNGSPYHSQLFSAVLDQKLQNLNTFYFKLNSINFNFNHIASFININCYLKLFNLLNLHRKSLN